MKNNAVQVIGAGFAGCECAYALAQAGIAVTLYEMKPQKFSPAHKNPDFCELICSNSFKAMRLNSAAGLLKEEMRRLGSLCVQVAEQTQVPAGGALAVDRDKFAQKVTQMIKAHPLIEVVEGEVTQIPQEGLVVIATGPLTSDALSKAILEKIGRGYLSFFDAAAPIVEAASIDFNKAFWGARYGRGEDDYINCPFTKEEYDRFYDALVNAQGVELHEFEKRDFKVYEGCMPIEVMARRGRDTLRFGPLKPVGLRDPRAPERRPYAVVQLRKENREGSMLNLVGFQTNLKFPEQKRVFSLIPGLENAEFVRFGVMHRNTFLDSPRLLDSHFNLKSDRRLYFAGQMTGVEGYMESASSGLLVGHHIARQLHQKAPLALPKDTMLGALSAYIADESVKDFQPMGANFGILPPLEERIRDKAQRYEQIASRALKSFDKALKAGEEKGESV